MTSKKQSYSTRSVRRINLTLPVVRTNAYEIYYTVPSAQTRQASTVRPVSRQKPAIDIDHNLKLNHQAALNRSPSRLKHLTGPILVNLFVDMPPIPTGTPSTAVDGISNALINSGYSGDTLRALPSMIKYSKYQSVKDDGERSQASSDDRLLFESVGSFGDPFMNRTSNGMWRNIQHPQFSTIKVLHARKSEKPLNRFVESHSQMPNTSSLGSLSQASMISTNDRLYEKVEQLTKNYFPSIQKLRHGHPFPELINSRMHLHREEKSDFVPALVRPRVGR